MVQNLREVSVHHIIILPVKFRKICIEKYMKMSLYTISLYICEGTRGEVTDVKTAGVKVEVEMSIGWCCGRRGRWRGM